MPNAGSSRWRDRRGPSSTPPDAIAEDFDSLFDQASTDADGILDLDVVDHTAQPLLVLRYDDGETACEALIDLSLVPGGRVDLGAVELTPAPIALAGLVLDDAGVTIPNAQLNMWSDRGSVRLELRSDGSFSYRTGVPIVAELTPSAPGRFEEHVRNIPYGTSDLRIIVRAPADVRGTLKLGGDAALENLTVLMLRAEAGQPIESAPGVSRSRTCEGEFEFKGIKSGRYTLLVRRSDAKPSTAPLYRRDDIVLPGDATVDLGQIRID
jgi:hypothetical protein